jgi:hypothetical protein
MRPFGSLHVHVHSTSTKITRRPRRIFRTRYSISPHFNEPTDHAATQAAFSLKRAGGGGPRLRHLGLVRQRAGPHAELAAAGRNEYTATVARTTKVTGGNALVNRQSRRFTTN